MGLTCTALTGTTAPIYTSSGDNAISTIIVCNPTGSPISLTMYAVPNNGGTMIGTASDSSNVIVYQLSIPAGDTVSFDQEKMVLTNYDSVQAKGNGLVATVSTLAV